MATVMVQSATPKWVSVLWTGKRSVGNLRSDEISH
jgi:hypothetical protein